MESMVIATAIASAFGAPRSNSTAQFRSKPRRILCSRKDMNSMPFTGAQKLRLESDGIGNLEEPFPPSENGAQINNSNDMWKLFNNAQRNIIYLNKQRVAALEELKKVENEKQLLLERLEQLEAGNGAGVAEDIRQRQKSTSTGLLGSSSFAELLLRIDSMVLSDMIGFGEASDIRKKIMDNKFAINDIFFGIQQKNDLELLSELRQFSENIMRKALHVVHICSEMEPIASFRPLAPYVTGLSSALERKGNTVEVILPKYVTFFHMWYSCGTVNPLVSQKPARPIQSAASYPYFSTPT